MPSLVERRNEIDVKTEELHALFKAHSTDDGYDFDADDLLEVNRRNDELAALNKTYEEQKALAETQKRIEGEITEQKRRSAPPMPSSNGNGHAPDTRTVGNPTALFDNGASKSMGERFTESMALAEYKGGVGPLARIDVDVRDVIFRPQGADFKTTMTTTAGWAPEVTRTGRLVLRALIQPNVVDLMPTSTTTQAGIKYMQETSDPSVQGSFPAMSVSEGGTKPEATLALNEVLVPVVKIAVLIPVTDEQLADVPQVQAYINNRLTWLVRQALDLQVINGSGTPPQMTGILTQAGTNVQTKGTDPTYDQIYKGMLQVQTTGAAEPSGILMNPADWAIIRLTRTANGEYIWGPPFEAGPTSLWGLPVVLSRNCPVGTAVVGDWSTYSELVTRQGIEIQTSNSHIDAFAKNITYIRAEMRAAALWYRPSAFTKCTGITAP